MQISEKDEGSLAAEQVIEKKASGIGRTFAALRHRNFRLFWCGQLISLIGTWMQTTGQSWLVLQLTKDAWALGIVGALQFLPVMLLSLFGGVLADRLPKRRMLLFTQSFAAIQATILWVLVATNTVQLWHVYILAFLLGLTNAFDMPTRQAFVVEMVGREDLPNAIALNSSLFNMARIVGPGLGGLIIAWQGEASLFLLNAISFIPVIAGLALIDLKQLHSQVNHKRRELQQGTFQSLREGLSYIRQAPAVLLIIVVIGTVSLFGINFNVVLPLFATDVLHAGPAGFGFISSAFGFGSLLSALWLAWRSNRPTISHMLLATIIFCVLEMLFALSHWYVLSLGLIAAVGFAQIAFSATANTTIQTISPDHLRGRIMSVYMLVFAGSVPLGNLFTGGLASQFNPTVALLAGGGLSLIAAVAGWILRAPAEKAVAEYTYVQE
ncbi:MFS transporter [Reticulibacter mediterranei]|uniref:MFS transporter n=1 Tax=Reticulibacter mediterranei TaxID=2778369 RepID=A0A8J3N0K3_9CHLR|nr:MFS transporter [Reticulibacter mediterranei]GHO91583.1 MFS transporter [Reticulibacter mediterranei]